MTTTTPAHAPDFSRVIGLAEQLVGDLASDVTATVKGLERVARPAQEALAAWSEDRVDFKKAPFVPASKTFLGAGYVVGGCAFGTAVFSVLDTGIGPGCVPRGMSGFSAAVLSSFVGHQAALPNPGTPFHERATLAREVLSQLLRTLPAEARAQYADRLSAANTRMTHVTDTVVALTAQDIDGAIAGAQRLK